MARINCYVPDEVKDMLYELPSGVTASNLLVRAIIAEHKQAQAQRQQAVSA